MNNDILISIIVPAYNVQNYINKCIDSILNQTYKNIEVIIVNDGSIDRTKEIINSCAEVDSRIVVFHTKNQGVSAARNLGIDEAHGEYLIFVDGDDYLSPDYVSHMLDLINRTNTEFAFSTKCYSSKYEKQTTKEIIKKVNSEDATTLLLSPDVTVGCWNKIYKKSLITENNIKFSTNLFYGEGLTFILRVASITSNVGISNRKVYYYRKNNEQSATSKFDINKLRNGEVALLDIQNIIDLDSKKIDEMYSYHLSLYRLGAIIKIKISHNEKYNAKEYKYWLSCVRKSCFKFIVSKNISLYRKALLICGAINPYFISKLEVFRQKMIVKNSVNH